MRLLGLALGLFVLLVACSSGESAGAVSQSCVPGQSTSCTGPGGCAGGQSCNAGGNSYGECVCGAPGTDDGGGGIDGSTSGDAGADAPTDPLCKGVDCNDGNDCTIDSCSGGKCSNPRALDDTPCAIGACKSGACTPCGNGQTCCPGSKCVGTNQICNALNVCETCGFTDQPCCLNSAGTASYCSNGGGQLRYCGTGGCKACGKNGQICCPTVPACSVGACTNGTTCS